MKRIFISLSVLCLISFTACKKSAETAVQESTDTVESAASRTLDEANGAVSDGSSMVGDLAKKGLAAVGAGGLTELLAGIPQLKDAGAIKTLTEYGGLVGKLIAASKTGSSDTASLQESVTTKFQEVTKVIQTLSPEEREKAMGWLSKLSEMVK